MVKRGFAFSLALVMCVSLLPTVSLAAEGDEGGGEPEITLVSVPETPKEVSSTEAVKDSDTPKDDGAKADEADDKANENGVDSGEADDKSKGDSPKADETNDKSKEDGVNAGENGDNSKEDGDEPKEDGGEPADPTEGDNTDSETPVQDDDTWDITQTQRPDASETVTDSTGTKDDKATPPEDPWTVFYDADEDVYKVTFNIGAEAEGTQTIDLTKALELMNKYAESGKKELQEAIDAQKKPTLELPSEPGKPEGLDEKTQAAFDEFAKMAAEDPQSSTVEKAKTYLAKQGLNVSDEYIEEYAEYMMSSADLKQVIANYNSGNLPGGLKGQDLDTVLYCYGVHGVKWTGGKANVGDPYIPAPEYSVDKTTPEYQEYEAKKAELEEKYASDKAAYDEAIQKLQAEFDYRINANNLEPGDVRKFELFFTSDSQLIYKYKDGSFTLATPGWLVDQTDPEQGVIGFDGQVLPDQYVDHAKYKITQDCEPIQALFEDIWKLYPAYQVNAQRNQYNDNKISVMLSAWKYPIEKELEKYPGDTPKEQLYSYILEYYGKKDNTEYETIDELIQTNPVACDNLTKTETASNMLLWIDGPVEVAAHTESVKYNTFYKNLFSFAFGSEEDIDQFLGEAIFNDGTNRWEYENDSWTDNGYQQALYYYMDHQEIWEKTDAYFNTLLEDGLSNEQATWTSLMMALNIDGELTGNLWQNTQWPWYSSIQLEQMDIDFTLSKKDQAGETITSGETGFQVYYIDKVKDENGTETSVNMYCTYDENTNAYTFVTTPSTVWTENGELNISYAMMKDVVYYLQEQTAPDGYEKDTNVYIVMSEDDYNQLTDEDKASLGEFDKYLDMTTSEDGLQVNADFINVKIVKPDPKPSHDPDPDPTPDPDPDPGIDIPEEDPPLADIPEEDPPLTDIPEEDPPLAEIPEEQPPLVEIPEQQPPLVDIPDEDVPLADVPETGDLSTSWYLALLLSACGLPALALLKKREQEA